LRQHFLQNAEGFVDLEAFESTCARWLCELDPLNALKIGFPRANLTFGERERQQLHQLLLLHLARLAGIENS
jgi:hypothetical protein